LSPRTALPGSNVGHALVAIALEPDSRGDYRVRSCYLVEQAKVEARRQHGRLKIVAPR